ncbi:hypothetical protein FACS1894110_25190 [Spirochaetia bacterium]|nr:hypothetical protein FACS1894110_25190 [Spirochaetia bacterium]
MAKNFPVSTSFMLKDQMTGPMGKIRQAVGAGFAAMGKDASRFNSILKGVTIGSLLSKGITSAIGAVRNNIGSAIGYASDLIETQNVVNSAFKEGAGVINEWATNSAKAYGLTELQAKKYASTLGSVFSGMGIKGPELGGMSMLMSNLAGDLASMYNLDRDDAFQKLLSGLTGQTAPLKSLGIVMSQDALEAFALSKGIKTSIKDMTEAGKAALRFQFIMANPAAKQAMGDYGKPIASWAVSSQDAIAAVQQAWGKLAEAFMPGIIRIADAIKGLADNVTEWARENSENIAKNISGLVDFIVKGINTIAKNIPQIMNKIKETIKLIGGLIKIIKDIAPVVVPAVLAFKAFNGVSKVFFGIDAAIKVMSGSTMLAAGTQGTLAGAIGTTTLAQWGLNAAAAAFPVTIIAAAVAGMISLIKHVHEANKLRYAEYEDTTESQWSRARAMVEDDQKRRFGEDAAAVEYRRQNPKLLNLEDAVNSIRAQDSKYDKMRMGQYDHNNAMETVNGPPGESAGMSDYEKAMLEYQDALKKYMEETAENTKTSKAKGSAGGLNYAGAGHVDIFGTVRSGLI